MMYGTYESAASNGSRNGYGLGLSSRHINIVECKNCFGQLMGETDNCCKGKTGWRILAPSCKIRYEQYLFFQQPLAQPLPAAQPLPNNEGKGGMSTTEIALISISAFTVVAALLGIYLYCSLGRKRTETVQENSQEILLNNMEGQNSKHFMEESMHEQSDEHIIEQSSSTTSKRKRTTSKVWDNFEKLSITADGKQKASCKKCKQEYIADAKSCVIFLIKQTLYFCGGEFFHVRCGAHILNLIVQAGLKVIDEAVNKIRESVKYVRGSEGRKIKFAECIAQLSLSCSKKVCQDVPTRWNYTYLMIDGALMYRRVFDQLQLIDVHFKTCPSDDE
ncbi:hypothetical protein F0562_014235 [Nyssa sinensis]|uniref:Gnk2-homologous domain-containing protein n=1 Tax=Nyssa sinensis TaxID=561372 RepID=A0A5J4ZPS5_9ASTE|nr:hypothetical protein F0562_014235 [Nyssa sinensis]